jgi:hypothetical protein
MLDAGQSETEPARDIRESDTCQAAIWFCQPQISATGRVRSPGQMIAKSCPYSDKDIRNDVVIDFIGSGDLRYEQKWIRPGSFSASNQQDQSAKDSDKVANPFPHRA